MGGKTALGYLTPKLLAERIERDFPDAQVTLDGARYKVIPGNPGKQIVYFTAVRFGNGPQVGNILRDLRKAGIDLERPEPTPAPAKPAAKADTPQESTMVSPGPGPGPLATRASVDDTREMVRTLETSILQMLAQADTRITKLEAENDSLREEITELRRRGVVSAPVPSRAQVIRDMVYAYFQQSPGQRLTPQVVDLNLVLDGKLPKDRPPTTVANACKTLAAQGKLQGGGTNGAKSDPTRGIYWLPKSKAVDTPKVDKQR